MIDTRRQTQRESRNMVDFYYRCWTSWILLPLLN